MSSMSRSIALSFSILSTFSSGDARPWNTPLAIAPPVEAHLDEEAGLEERVEAEELLPWQGKGFPVGLHKALVFRPSSPARRYG